MKFKRKILILMIILLILLTNISFGAEPNLASASAILVETSTNKILFEKNAYEKMYPASTTKIMTAILTLEKCDLNEKATVSHNAIFSLPNGYVNANLQEGEEMEVKDLLYALMVKSANDAAIVLAEHIGGSVEGFADMMNEKAKELGCKNTHFVNPNGIHNENHYSTAYDLYVIANYCMKNTTFRKYVSTVNYTLPATNKYPTNDRICLTTNDMIRTKSKYYNENIIGIKTGYTKEAKNCLISGAKKDDVELISVVLCSGTNSEGLSERYLDTSALFDYGFNNFEFKNIIEKDQTVKNIEVENGNKDTKNLDLISTETLSDYINNDIDLSTIEPTIELNDNIKAPISKGTTLGNVTYKINDIEYKTDLVASHDVEKCFDTKIIILIVGILLLLFSILLLAKSSKRTHKPRRK